jgi:hypothetical protein
VFRVVGELLMRVPVAGIAGAGAVVQTPILPHANSLSPRRAKDPCTPFTTSFHSSEDFQGHQVASPECVP